MALEEVRMILEEARMALEEEWMVLEEARMILGELQAPGEPQVVRELQALEGARMILGEPQAPEGRLVLLHSCAGRSSHWDGACDGGSELPHLPRAPEGTVCNHVITFPVATLFLVWWVCC